MARKKVNKKNTKIVKTDSKIKSKDNNNKKLVLNLGCGLPKDKTLLPAFTNDDWQEIRLDSIDEAKPEILSKLHNIPKVKDQTIDAVNINNSLERLTFNEAIKTLTESFRVLKNNGIIYIIASDIQHISEHIQDGKLEGQVVVNDSYRFSPINLVFGNANKISNGEAFRVKKTAFTASTLANKLTLAGFSDIVVRQKDYMLIAEGRKKTKKVNNARVFNNNNTNKMMKDRDNLYKKPNLKINY